MLPSNELGVSKSQKGLIFVGHTFTSECVAIVDSPSISQSVWIMLLEKRFEKDPMRDYDKRIFRSRTKLFEKHGCPISYILNGLSFSAAPHLVLHWHSGFKIHGWPVFLKKKTRKGVAKTTEFRPLTNQCVHQVEMKREPRTSRRSFGRRLSG